MRSDEMKIIIATTKGGLDDDVSRVFGRCPTFTVVEIEGKEIKSTEVIGNQYKDLATGAGIKAAQFVVSKGANAVAAGDFGPNASAVFSQAGVEMISVQGKAKDIVDRYLSWDNKPQNKGPTPPVQPSSGGFGPGMGRGMGRGAGRGMGFGFRGSSPDWPYVGLGRGGLPRCWAYNAAANAPAEPAKSIKKDEEKKMLQDDLEDLEKQVAEIKNRLKSLE